jgi:hypothetical protein
MYFKAGDRPCRLCSHNGFGRVLRAAAGSVRSEHRNVDILIPLARPRESPTGPNVPCERRTDPAEPPPPTSPWRQPQHSATAKQVRAPGNMRRSFRTHRLCAIPGVSTRAGIRCPVGAPRTPQHPLEALIPRRQPRHSANAKQVRAPGNMRRSFRTHRLCGIPGVSPRAGMRCPVGALRTPQHPLEALIPRRQPRHSANAKQVRAPPCISKLGIDLVVCVHITDSGGCSGRQRDRSGASIGTSTP